MSAFISFLGITMVGGGAFLGYSGWNRRRERRTIAERETTDVLSVTPGPTEVYGEALPADAAAMNAPFSDDECLLAEWEIEEWDTSGKHSSWTTRGSGTLAVPFEIDDGTDSIRVDPTGADIELSGEYETVEVGIDEHPPTAVRRFVELDSTPGEASGSLLSALELGNKTGDRKYHQRIVRPGEACYVHGTATRAESREFGDRSHEIRRSVDDGHADADLFLVSDSTEADLLSSRRDAELRLAGGVLGTILGVVLLASVAL